VPSPEKRDYRNVGVLHTAYNEQFAEIAPVGFFLIHLLLGYL